MFLSRSGYAIRLAHGRTKVREPVEVARKPAWISDYHTVNAVGCRFDPYGKQYFFLINLNIENYISVLLKHWLGPTSWLHIWHIALLVRPHTLVSYF